MNALPALRQVLEGAILARTLQQVVGMGVFDAVGEGPTRVEDVAAEVGADSDALTRALRLIASHGFLSLEAGQVSHTELSRTLRRDHPQSLRDFVLQFASDFNWRCFGEMAHTLRTGEPASERVYPGGPWKWRQDHPEEAALFNRGMEARARERISQILAAYDFSAFGRIADLGGGTGHLLRAILTRAPEATGVLFDLPQAIDQARAIPSERLSFEAGSFFEDPLPEADAYLLMDILHDWHYEDCVRILGAIRKAAQPGAKVLIIEMLLPSGPEPHWAKALDIQMLVLFAGRQRSLSDFAELLAASGFSVPRETRLANGFSIVEATAI